MIDFQTAFKYPFNRPKGMLNILWVLFPIFGWLALLGYGIKIVKEFLKGNFKTLPEMHFVDNMVFGTVMLIKAIPFMIAYMAFSMIINWFIPYSFVIGIFVGIFIIPIMSINFFNKETVESFFEFGIISEVFDNIYDYIYAILMSFILSIVFLIMFIVLVGIPAGQFTKNIFMADFYRLYILKGATPSVKEQKQQKQKSVPVKKPAAKTTKKTTTSKETTKQVKPVTPVNPLPVKPVVDTTKKVATTKAKVKVTKKAKTAVKKK